MTQNLFFSKEHILFVSCKMLVNWFWRQQVLLYFKFSSDRLTSDIFVSFLTFHEIVSKTSYWNELPCEMITFDNAIRECEHLWRKGRMFWSLLKIHFGKAKMCNGFWVNFTDLLQKKQKCFLIIQFKTFFFASPRERKYCSFWRCMMLEIQHDLKRFDLLTGYSLSFDQKKR